MSVVVTRAIHCDRCRKKLNSVDDPTPEKLEELLAEWRVVNLDLDLLPLEGKSSKFVWELLCEECEELVRMFFLPLEYQHFKLSEGNDGLAFWEKWVGYAKLGTANNTPDERSKAQYAKSVMYRAMRLLGWPREGR